MLRKRACGSSHDDFVLLSPRGAALGAMLLVVATASANERAPCHAATVDLVARGRQALSVCNGLFVSGRTLEQIYAGELRADGGEPLPASRLTVDRTRRVVAVGTGAVDPVPVMRAAHREGVGCVAMAPHQTPADIDSLPMLQLARPPGDPASIPWPDGDQLAKMAFPADVRKVALDHAGDWAFDRTGHGGYASQVTLSLLVVHRGRLLYERYAPGVDMRTRTRTWSAAKSIAATLVGIAVGEHKIELDAPLPFDWPPDELKELESRAMKRSPMLGAIAWPPALYERAADPRRHITLRHVLNMSSGLYPVDNEHGDTLGSALSYFAGTSSASGARDRGLVREPGTVWDYENYDALLAVLALRTALEDPRIYLEFPRRALFDRIGMRNTVAGVDRFGDFVMSSQVYTNARDLARFGLLYLNRGVWRGQRILPAAWVDFVRSPAPATARFGNFYGGQFWLVPDSRTDLPADAYTASGAQGQFVLIVPSHDLVVVRRGLDQDGPAFPAWDLLVEVLKALPPAKGGTKPASQAAVRFGLVGPVERERCQLIRPRSDGDCTRDQVRGIPSAPTFGTAW